MDNEKTEINPQGVIEAYRGMLAEANHNAAMYIAAFNQEKVRADRLQAILDAQAGSESDPPAE